jgi:hypothetical protein
MSSLPAFLFFPSRWLSGTQLFSRLEKGAYIDLLIAQFNNGHLTLKNIQGVLGSDFESLWQGTLSTKFLQDSNGLFFNDFLEEVKQKSEVYKANRLKNLGITLPTSEAHTHTPCGEPTCIIVNKGRDKDKKEGIIRGEREGKGKGNPICEPTWENTGGDSERIFNLYPKNTRKLAAIKEIEIALSKIPFDKLSKLVTIFSNSMRSTEKRFIPSAPSWFAEERWKEISSPAEQDRSELKRTEKYLENLKNLDSEGSSATEQIKETLPDTNNPLPPAEQPSQAEESETILLDYLQPAKVQRILELMPLISPQYINEKIAILKIKNPENKESFLYSSILQNYKKPDKARSVSSVPINQTQYDSLSSQDKLKYIKIDHQKPGSSIFRLISFPQKILASERFAFSLLSIGSEIDEFSLLKFSLKTREHFQRINVQPLKILMYHPKTS